MIYRDVWWYLLQTETKDGAAAALPGLFEALCKSDDNAKRAITAYLFFAVEGNPDERLRQLFDALCLAGGGEAGEYSLAKGYGDFADDRDAVIRICDAYLESAEDSDERYGIALGAIHKASEYIYRKASFFSWPKGVQQDHEWHMKLAGTTGTLGFLSVNIALLVYNLVLAGMRAGIYEGNREKLARFIVRFTGRDKAALAELEEVARWMLALEERIAGVKKSGDTETYEHVSSQLAALQAEKLPVKEQLANLFRRDLYAEREPEKET
jgi:hypothetical protein